MWIKLDDGFATHPKILKAGPYALVLQIRALCYASTHQTDGFIDGQVTDFLTTGLDPEIDWPGQMLEYALWDADDERSGYRIHDYLEWNLSKKERESFRNKKSQAGKKGMKARWGTALPSITEPITDVITHAITKPYHPISTVTSVISSRSSPNPKSTSETKKNGHGKRPWPEDLRPTDKHHRLAEEWKIDLGFEWGKFKNYCMAHDKRYANYEAAFRNWLANVFERKESHHALRKM